MDAYTHAQLKYSFDKPHNSQPQAERTQSVAPPRISACKMDGIRGLCIGCTRTIDETASRPTMNDAARLAVREALSERACAWLDDTPCA